MDLSYRPPMMRKMALLMGVVVSLAACPERTARPSADPIESAAASASSDPARAERRAPRRCRELDELVRRVKRGYVARRSPDLNLIPREPNYIGAAAAPVHSGPWDYLAEVPLLVHGPGFVRARTFDRPVTMADVAPTTAALIGSRFRARDGRALSEALRSGSKRPRLVVTVVWDGGGWNVLNEHRSAHPYFDALTKRSASFTEMEIGSSPSVTPPIHATLSTGAFPRRHGIPGLRMRVGSEYVDPFIRLDPSNLELPTLADVYDRETRNRAVVGMLAGVNWHLAMIGHGAALRGADRDPAVLFHSPGEGFTNAALYSLPEIDDPELLLRYAARLDARDGERDGSWQGHPLDDPDVRYASPAHVRYEQVLLERLIVAERFGRDRIPDLLYVNFKPSDDAGHNWGMSSDEVADVLRAQDRALRRLVDFLDRRVGKKRWVLFLTADHGQTRYPRQSKGWAIAGGELARDANRALDRNDNDATLIDRVSSPGAFVNRAELRSNSLTMDEVAGWIAAYPAEQNLTDGASMPRWFRGRGDELLFDAVVVRDRRVVSEACR